MSGKRQLTRGEATLLRGQMRIVQRACMIPKDIPRLRDGVADMLRQYRRENTTSNPLLRRLKNRNRYVSILREIVVQSQSLSK